MIKVANKHWYKGEGFYIGRPSPLGNPFSHLEKTKALFRCADRAEAVSRYEEWLRSQINKDPEITSELKKLYAKWQNEGNLTLVCWCKPAACHGDVIKRILEEKKERA